MKVVINSCHGGFGLSPQATELYLKKIGKECFFYKQIEYEHNGNEEYVKIPKNESDGCMIYHVQTKDLGDVIHKLDNDSYWYGRFDSDRSNTQLIETVEELGCKESSGAHAELKIVEIPDDVEYTIDEYDGIESIHEAHRSWG